MKSKSRIPNLRISHVAGPLRLFTGNERERQRMEVMNTQRHPGKEAGEWRFRNSKFGFVSDFGIRISELSRMASLS
jgi:hypothetical protein